MTLQKTTGIAFEDLAGNVQVVSEAHPLPLGGVAGGVPVKTLPAKGASVITAVAVGSTNPAVLMLATNNARISGTIFNNSSQTVYRGTTNAVTVATGYPIPPGAEFVDDTGTSNWYGIVASGTGDVRVEEMS